MDSEHYVFVGDHFLTLLMGQGLLEHSLMKIKVKYMPPEEKKRYELIEQKRLEALEEKERKAEIIRKLQAQSEQDRKEKAEQKAKASVAN
jgi:hypothetical protein